MTKRMLADVLWEAANDALSAHPSGLFEFSCDAVMCVIRRLFHGGSLWSDRTSAEDGARTFLRALGCPVSSDTAFTEFDEENRQGVRYMWLLLAMHVAEDEGIEV